MSKHSAWLVVYDIRDGYRLRKIERIVESYGKRIQKSVYQINATEKIVNLAFKEFKSILESDDFLLIFPLCEKDLQKREFYGIVKKEKFGKDKESYLIL